MKRSIPSSSSRAFLDASMREKRVSFESLSDFLLFAEDFFFEEEEATEEPSEVEEEEPSVVESEIILKSNF